MERKRWRRDSSSEKDENLINSILDENYGDYSDDEEIIFLRWSDDENDQGTYTYIYIGSTTFHSFQNIQTFFISNFQKLEKHIF